MKIVNPHYLSDLIAIKSILQQNLPVIISVENSTEIIINF